MPIYSFRSVWKKKFFNREKKREIAFRQKLIDKVRTAEKFDPEVCKVLFKLMNSKCLASPGCRHLINKNNYFDTRHTSIIT